MKRMTLERALKIFTSHKVFTSTSVEVINKAKRLLKKHNIKLSSLLMK